MHPGYQKPRSLSADFKPHSAIRTLKQRMGDAVPQIYYSSIIAGLKEPQEQPTRLDWRPCSQSHLGAQTRIHFYCSSPEKEGAKDH